MKRFVMLSIITGLLFVGCGSEDKKTDTTPHKDIKVSQKTDPVSTHETEKSRSDQISEKTDEMKKAAEELATAIQEKTAPMVEKTKETATELAGAFQEKTASVVENTKETTAALVETVKEKSTPVIVKGIETATELTEKATETLHGKGPDVPIVVYLENKNGKITLPHKAHSDSLACVTCHGETEPGSFSLGKDAGHKLCKGCHEEKKIGPTKCTGCHEKTVLKTIEGC